MKKLICLLLAVIMTAAAFAGCAGKPEETGTSPAETGNSSYPGKTDDTAAESKDQPSNPVDPQVSAQFENLKASDTFTFGTWEQDGKSGSEPITWVVLRQDVGKMLVLSEKLLEYMCFIAGTEENKYPRGLYKDSDLRTFLNGDFYNKAFTDDEKAMIQSSVITTNYKDEHYNELTYQTEDKVFALSKDEAARYVCSLGATVFGVPTQRVSDENPYKVSNVSGVNGVENAMTWWLRDMGVDSSKYASVITANTTRKYNNDDEVYEGGGMRPAMWIVYNAADAEGYAKGEVKPKEDEQLNAKIAALKVGSKIQFGVYDNNLYSMDGFETLSWTVIDEDDISFLILSDTNAGSSYSVFDNRQDIEDTSWAESYLRAYINSDEFLDMTFTPQEKAKLILTHITTSGEDSRDGGAATDDLLFIPDVNDVEKYSSVFSININAKYWLRSQMSWAPYIAFASGNGSVSSSNPDKTYAIRLMARIKK